MSKARASLQPELDRVTARLAELFPDHRLERDKNAEPVLWVKAPDELLPLLRTLMQDSQLGVDRLSDITAYDNIDKVDGPKRFIVVHQLYIMKTHARIRLKLGVDESDDVPSLTGIWRAANWLEREVYDMYGIRFSNHPDLRRILMDERFVGHPLRKEYDLKERQPFPDTLPVRIAERTVREEEPHT